MLPSLICKNVAGVLKKIEDNTETLTNLCVKNIDWLFVDISHILIEVLNSDSKNCFEFFSLHIDHLVKTIHPLKCIIFSYDDSVFFQNELYSYSSKDMETVMFEHNHHKFAPAGTYYSHIFNFKNDKKMSFKVPSNFTADGRVVEFLNAAAAHLKKKNNEITLSNENARFVLMPKPFSEDGKNELNPYYQYEFEEDKVTFDLKGFSHKVSDYLRLNRLQPTYSQQASIYRGVGVYTNNPLHLLHVCSLLQFPYSSDYHRNLNNTHRNASEDAGGFCPFFAYLVGPAFDAYADAPHGLAERVPYLQTDYVGEIRAVLHQTLHPHFWKRSKQFAPEFIALDTIDVTDLKKYLVEYTPGELADVEELSVMERQMIISARVEKERKKGKKK